VKVYLVHHVEALPEQKGPQRHISAKGRQQADRLGKRLAAAGVAPKRVLHSDKQWSIDTAEHIAEALGVKPALAMASYPIHTGDAIGPFISEIAEAGGDIMMCGHMDYLMRTASTLVSGDETRKVLQFKPGHGTTVCLEGEGRDWAVAFLWRQDDPSL
jgi:phosphohistidine phosphatase SixA